MVLDWFNYYGMGQVVLEKNHQSNEDLFSSRWGFSAFNNIYNQGISKASENV